MQFPLLIAVSGKIGVGKDYIIETMLIPMLQKLNLTVTRMAFADHLKVNVASQHGVQIEQCLSGSKPQHIRHLLQSEGTENGRDIYGDDIWVRTLENWIKLRSIRDENLDVVLITDCRFPNEAAWVERRGGLLVRVHAPVRNQQRLQQESGGNMENYIKISSHRSEIALDNYKFRYTIHNDPGTDTGKQVEHILLPILRGRKGTWV